MAMLNTFSKSNHGQVGICHCYIKFCCVKLPEGTGTGILSQLMMVITMVIQLCTGGCGNRFCLQLNGSFPCGKAIRVSRYFLRLAWVLHDSLKVARLNLAATSMGIPVYQWKLLYIIRCCPDSHFCHDLLRSAV